MTRKKVDKKTIQKKESLFIFKKINWFFIHHHVVVDFKKIDASRLAAELAAAVVLLISLFI